MGEVTNETRVVFVGLPAVDGWRDPKSQIRMAESDAESDAEGGIRPSAGAASSAAAGSSNLIDDDDDMDMFGALAATMESKPS